MEKSSSEPGSTDVHGMNHGKFIAAANSLVVRFTGPTVFDATRPLFLPLRCNKAHLPGTTIHFYKAARQCHEGSWALSADR